MPSRYFFVIYSRCDSHKPGHPAVLAVSPSYEYGQVLGYLYSMHADMKRSNTVPDSDHSELPPVAVLYCTVPYRLQPTC